MDRKLNPLKVIKGLGLAAMMALPLMVMTGCSQNEMAAETERRIAEIQSLPNMPLVSRAQLAQQIEAEVAVQVNRDRLQRRVELEEARSNLLLRELSSNEAQSVRWFVRAVESSLAQENITQFNHTNLFVPFTLREALRYQTDGLVMTMLGYDSWTTGIHREFLYVDVPFSVAVHTGEPLELNEYARYVGVSGVFRKGRLDGNYNLDLRWLGVLYANLERNMYQALGRFNSGTITYTELRNIIGNIDISLLEDREPIVRWDEEQEEWIIPYEDVIGFIEHDFTVAQMNAIVGQDRSEPAMVPSISLISADEYIQLSGFGGYNLVGRGHTLQHFGFDVSQLTGTAVVRFVFETTVGTSDLANPSSLNLVNLYFRSLEWNDLPDMRTNVVPFPVFLEDLMSSLIDAGDRVVMNNDVTGALAGRIYRDPRETLLHGVGNRGYHRHRRISEIAPLEYPYLMNRITGALTRINQEIDSSTGEMRMYTVCPVEGRLELELNFGRLSMQGFRRLDNGEWETFPIHQDGEGNYHPQAGERRPIIEGTVEYEYGQSSFLQRVDNYFLVEVTRTIMQRPNLVHAVQGTWVETWLYVFELDGSDLFVVDRFRTSKVMHRDIYLFSGNQLERRLVYLSLSGIVTNETRNQVEVFFEDYISTLNRMNIEGPNAIAANRLRDVILTQDTYMLDTERAARIRNWIADNLTREGTRTRVTGGITDILAGTHDQVEILTLEMVEYAGINVALVLENYMLLQRFGEDDEWAIAEIRNMSSERIHGEAAIIQVRERIQTLQGTN